MPKDPELSKHTINLRAGDIDYIATIAEVNGLTTSFIVRRIISDYVDKMRDKEAPIAIEGDL
jgi:hypothetical protein